MTLDEKYQWLSSIATQADTLFAEPEDMLMVAGCLLTTAIGRLPKADRKRALNEWVDHASRAIATNNALSDAIREPNVSRH